MGKLHNLDSAFKCQDCGLYAKEIDGYCNPQPELSEATPFDKQAFLDAAEAVEPILRKEGKVEASGLREEISNVLNHTNKFLIADYIDETGKQVTLSTGANQILAHFTDRLNGLLAKKQDLMTKSMLDPEFLEAVPVAAIEQLLDELK